MFKPNPRHGRLLGAALVAVALGTPIAARAATPSESIAAGDAAYAKGSLTGAHAEYTGALAGDSTSFAALWRMTRVESELGEDAKGEEQKQLISSAVGHARRAVKLAPDSALGHVWLAVALGRQALKEGPKARLALAREIKSETDRAIALDPTIGRAWHVRAAWNRKIASLNTIERMAANTVLGGVPKGASMDNAVADFKKAIELEPGYVNHRLELGRTYMQLKRWPEARAELDKAIALSPTSNPRDPHYQQEARELLAKLPKG